MSSSAAQGGLSTILHHRARLFPLPYFPPAWKPPCGSARNRKRFKMAHTITAVTNRCLLSLNRLYDSSPSAPLPSFISSYPSSVQPDNSFCPSRSSPQSSTSAGQLRALTHIRDQCSVFVLKVRAWRHPGPACDIDRNATDVLSSFSFTSTPHRHSNRPLIHPTPTSSPCDHISLEGPLPSAASWSSVPLPLSSSFSTASTTVVPLQASRVALPDHLNIVPLASVLPPSVAALYSEAANPALLRSPIEVFTLNCTHPLKKARIAGSRSEYVKLVGRLVSQGMLAWTDRPKAVNGVFTVGKDADADRLIIDAQPANRLFVDAPHVSLPNPSHLVQMQVPNGMTMFVGKSDLSNFYHHLGLPTWMQKYFALPSLSPEEMRSIGLDPSDGRSFPMCVTLPMGFAHAVYLAETSHEHVVYGSGALQREDNLLHMASPVISQNRATHGIIIDDFFLFCLNRQLAMAQFQRVLAAYRAAGFLVKSSKVVEPTSSPVKVIGFDICGADSTVSLPLDSTLSLLTATTSVLRTGLITGTGLAHLIGRWTWCMLLRRPSLRLYTLTPLKWRRV